VSSLFALELDSESILVQLLD